MKARSDPLMSQRILTINTGSSSLKVALYDLGRQEKLLLSGECERIGQAGGRWHLSEGDGVDQHGFADHGAAIDAFLTWLRERRPELLVSAVGHRLVHGGADHREPERIEPPLIAALQKLVPIAPNHLPQAIQAIQTSMRVYPDLPQAACFDTAFHRHMPRLAQLFPLPRQLSDAGIVRYGFHGLSYEYIMQELRTLAPQEAEGRVIIAHLGNGASMAAVRGGIGVDTTMGFTPTGGLMMGTRTGDLDPGILLYLLSERQMTPAALADLVNRQSGLLGVSQISADMRDLLKRSAVEPHAAEAVDLFCYVAKKFVGALAAALCGLDTLVFTGGIGEHSAPIRARICAGLEFMGFEVDADRNQAQAAIISRDGSRVTVRVIKTDEDLMIARHTKRLMPGTPIS